MTQSDRHFRVKANKAFAILLIVFVGLFGLGFVAMGLKAMSSAAFYEWAGQIAVGGVILFAAVRLTRHFFKPYASLTATDLVLRPFWRFQTRWPYADTARWEVEVEIITKGARGKKLPMPLRVERLYRTDVAGVMSHVVLPGFSGENAVLLKELALRSGKPIDHLPTREK